MSTGKRRPLGRNGTSIPAAVKTTAVPKGQRLPDSGLSNFSDVASNETYSGCASIYSIDPWLLRVSGRCSRQ